MKVLIRQFFILLTLSIFIFTMLLSYCWTNRCNLPFYENNNVIAKINTVLNPTNKYSSVYCETWKNYNEIVAFINENSNDFDNLKSQLASEGGNYTIFQNLTRCKFQAKLIFRTKNSNSTILDEIRLKYGDKINGIDYDFIYEK